MQKKKNPGALKADKEDFLTGAGMVRAIRDLFFQLVLLQVELLLSKEGEIECNY